MAAGDTAVVLIKTAPTQYKIVLEGFQAIDQAIDCMRTFTSVAIISNESGDISCIECRTQSVLVCNQ